MNDFNTPNQAQSPSQEQVKQYGRQAAGMLNRHKKPLIIFVIILVALGILWSECFFIVNEAEQAVISRFGVIKQVVLNEGSTFYEMYSEDLKDEITMNGDVKIKKGSGLHFRVPFIDKVEKFSSMLYTYTSNSETINTSDKKQYNVTTYAQWRIAEPALFTLKLGNPRNAENQLDNLIHPVIVQAINRLTGDDFISNKDALNAALKRGLEQINQDMVIRGIQVQDIQVHRSILPNANVETTYDRMKADRAKVAQQLRSEGEQSYQMAVSDTDLRASIINSDAVKEAGSIRALADAEVMAIYADAYKVNEDFYTFWRSLQALQGTLTDNSTLVLSQDHPLWQQLLKWGLGTEN